MWSPLPLSSNNHWLKEAIEAGICVAVTDGLYIHEVFPNVYSAAFIPKCNKGRGRIIGSLPERPPTSNTY